MQLFLRIYLLLSIILYIRCEIKKLPSDYYLRIAQIYIIVIDKKHKDERYNSLLEESYRIDNDVIEDEEYNNQ